jgi:hypothetical protein
MEKRTYLVSAPSRVLGHEPGTEFEAELTAVQEARLLASGALKTVTASGGGESDLDDLKRDELNELAAEAGIEAADELPNRAAVIEAINQKEKD